jgi:hypothetical protein
VNQLTRVLQVKDAQQAQQLNAMKMDEYKRGIEDQNALRAGLSAPGADPYSVLLSRGRVKEAGDFLKSQNEAEKAKREAAKADLEMGLKKASHVSSILSQARDPQSYGVVRNVIKAQFGMDLPDQFDPAFVQARVAEGQTITERLKAEHDRLTREETGRHNRSTEATAQGQLGVAQGNLGLRRQELDFNRSQPRGVIVQGESGPMLADPRAGTAVPLRTPDGQVIGPKLKDAPPAVQQAVLSNAQNLSRAERALQLVTGNDIGDPSNGGQKGDKEATGLKGYLPNQMLNRADPKGVDARAAIADLGSLVIHDRSGAAVTAAEFPRLAPFIPTEKDDNATVKKKLNRFIQVYREEMGAMQQAYNPDTGYRTPGGKAPAAGAPNLSQFKVLGVEK